MEDRELRERLGRIEQHLGIPPYEDSYEPGYGAPQKENVIEKIQTIKVDRIGELLLSIAEKKKEVSEEAFLAYLNKMEQSLCRQQVVLDDYAANLEKNFKVYEQRQSAAAAATVAEQEVTKQPLQTASQPAAEPSQPVKKSAAKTDMEFGIGAVVLSIIGALFIIASLVTFGLNFMDNIQQGIFFYILAIIVIAFSEFVLRRHLERFAQAVTGIGVCVLYTATILNYLYLHTMNSVAALAATVAVSVFALLLSRKRESASLRMIGILGCYISLMPLDKFKSEIEFIIPCVILLIVNVIYLLLPVSAEDKAVRNVHSVANLVAATWLVVTAWTSGLSAVPMFVMLVFMVAIHYMIYDKLLLKGSVKAFYVIGQLWLHALLAFTIWDEKFFVAGSLVVALVHAAGFFLYKYRMGQRPMTETDTWPVWDPVCKWIGLHGFASYLVIGATASGDPEFLAATAAVLALYKLFAMSGELRVANKIVSVSAAVILLIAMLMYQSNSAETGYMEYVLLAVFVLSVVCMRYDKTFHANVIMIALWGFSLFAFDALEIVLPLSVILVLVCVLLFTKVELYRPENIRSFTTCAWILNGISLMLILFSFGNPNRISMSIILVAESALLMLLFSDDSGIKKENLTKCRAHALTIFFTYMVFAFGIELPIVVSILLMLIAIASVAAGFVLKIKSVRIYGLCMSLFVCAKLLLVDFSDAQTADRVISFLVVGVIALAISYLYMRIERTLQQKEQEEVQEEVQQVAQEVIHQEVIQKENL